MFGNPVNSYKLSPDHYVSELPCDGYTGSRWGIIDNLPYKTGDVVYISTNDGYCKAIIRGSNCDRNDAGFWFVTYHVYKETKSGNWSKKYITVTEHDIQNGYIKATK